MLEFPQGIYTHSTARSFLPNLRKAPSFAFTQTRRRPGRCLCRTSLCFSPPIPLPLTICLVSLNNGLPASSSISNLPFLSSTHAEREPFFPFFLLTSLPSRVHCYRLMEKAATRKEEEEEEEKDDRGNRNITSPKNQRGMNNA